MNNMIKCEICGKEISKYGIKNHIRLKHTEEGQLKCKEMNKGKNKGRTPHNKGKLTSEEIKTKISNSLKGKTTGKASTEEKEIERKRKISESMKGKYGGYRKGSGRGKSGWYKGYWCDSSWELAFVIYNLEHNIPFTRNTQKFEYFYNQQKHYYIPDFIINNTFIEIKGYENEQTLEKYKSCPNLIVLKEKDLIDIFDYVIDKYGSNYVDLYKME